MWQKERRKSLQNCYHKALAKNALNGRVAAKKPLLRSMNIKKDWLSLKRKSIGRKSNGVECYLPMKVNLNSSGIKEDITFGGLQMNFSKIIVEHQP